MFIFYKIILTTICVIFFCLVLRSLRLPRKCFQCIWDTPHQASENHQMLTKSMFLRVQQKQWKWEELQDPNNIRVFHIVRHPAQRKNKCDWFDSVKETWKPIKDFIISPPTPLFLTYSKFTLQFTAFIQFALKNLTLQTVKMEMVNIQRPKWRRKRESILQNA